MMFGNEQSIQEYREARPVRSARLQAGVIIEPRQLATIHSERIPIPDPERLVHLQFRRFAGCPVCSLHLRSFVRRNQELTAASIRELVIFHSTTEELMPHAGDLPFAIIADPHKRIYAAFGVESGPRSLFDPRAWMPIVRGVFHSSVAVLRGEHPVPSLNPHGGRFGLPADFLIAPGGRVLACKYGSHVYDQWSVEEVLVLARLHSRCNVSDHAERPGER